MQGRSPPFLAFLSFSARVLISVAGLSVATGQTAVLWGGDASAKQTPTQVTIALGSNTFMEMAWIPPGKYSLPETVGKGGAQEGQIIGGFWMGKYEVTQKQWSRFMPVNPSEFRGEELPVENVTWLEVQKFLRELNKARVGTNATFSLPSKAEWEYAYLAGRGRTYVLRTDEVCRTGWVVWNSGDRTHPVGSKLPNAWALYDMRGNVAELVSDLHVTPVPYDGGFTSWTTAVYCGSWWHASETNEFEAGGSAAVNFGACFLGFRVVLRTETSPKQLLDGAREGAAQ
jgi:formylglycine-generating enzyme required for sulfatase activity